MSNEVVEIVDAAAAAYIVTGASGDDSKRAWALKRQYVVTVDGDDLPLATTDINSWRVLEATVSQSTGSSKSIALSVMQP